MNHPLTEKILEEFEKEFDQIDDPNVMVEFCKDFLLSAIKRTANEFRVEEKMLGRDELCEDVWRGYNQCAKETNAKVDEFNPTT